MLAILKFMRFKIPHTYVLLFSIIVLAAALTWIVPAGEFDRVEQKVGESTRLVPVPGSYHLVESNPQSWQVFSALFNGFVKQAAIIAFIFIVGGVFFLVQKTQAIDRGIFDFINFASKLNKYRFVQKVGGSEQMVVAACMLLFGVFGSVFGMSEETIPFVLVFVPLSISLGYDSIVGVAMCFLGAAFGFAGATLNPFTIGIAQGIAGVQPFSGLEYRIIVFIILMSFAIFYVLRYAKRIKQNPSLSPVYEEDAYWRNTSNSQSESAEPLHIKADTKSVIAFALSLVVFILFAFQHRFTGLSFGSLQFQLPMVPALAISFAIFGAFALKKSKAYFILTLLAYTILVIIVGVLGYNWYVSEIATLFLAFGILSGVVYGFNGDTIANYFIEGFKDIAGAAIVVGLAAGILEILNSGKIIDTLLNHVATSFADLPASLSVGIMFLVQTLVNIFVPSGSGQAALTMPLMAPLADLLGVSRQSAVMAFQFGDGFTNMITPTSGVLIAVIGMAKIPYKKWLTWIIKLQLWLLLIGFLLLLPTVFLKLPGF